MIESTIGKLQGKQNWPTATATVTDKVDLGGGGRSGPPAASITFIYRDAAGDLQSGNFRADSTTSLYNLEKDDTFDIRFDPKKPSHFYTSELDSVFTEFQYGFWLCLGIATLIITAIILLKK